MLHFSVACYCFQLMEFRFGRVWGPYISQNIYCFPASSFPFHLQNMATRYFKRLCV
jgi:hypothetical protein